MLGHALGESEMLESRHIARSFAKTRARGSSAHRTRPWPQCRSHQGSPAVFPKPQFRDQHERGSSGCKCGHPRICGPVYWARAVFPGLALIPGRTTRKVGLSDGSRLFPTTSGPRCLMSQWPNSTSPPTRSCSHSIEDVGPTHVFSAVVTFARVVGGRSMLSGYFDGRSSLITRPTSSRSVGESPT